MWRVAVRDMRKHWGRFVLTLLAVVFGIAFLTGTLMLRGVMADTFQKLLTTSLTAPLYVENEARTGTPPFEHAAPLTEPVADKIRELKEIKYADPVYQDIGAIIDTAGKPVVMNGAPTLFFSIYGNGNDPDLVAGTAPKGDNEVGVVGAILSDTLRVGDTVKIIRSGTIKDVKVTGAYDFGASTFGAAYVFIPHDQARGMPFTSIAVAPASGYSDDQVIKAINSELKGLKVSTKEKVIEQANEQINLALGFINTFLLVFVAIAIFVGAFIISNSFRMSVKARQREFALLRAIGASTWNVFSIVLAQAILLGLAGSALGIGAGVGLIKLLTGVLDYLGIALADSIPLTTNVVVLAFALGLAVTIFGSLLPAREAATTPPLQAMRSSDGSSSERIWPRLVIAAPLIGAGAAGLVYAATNPDAKWAGWALGGGAIGLLIGILVIAAVAIPPIAHLASLPLLWVRPQTRLAVRNVIRHRRRTAATASALIIGIALVSAGAVLAQSAKSSTADLVDDQLLADLTISSSVGGGGIAPNVVDRIKSVPGIESTTVVDPPVMVKVAGDKTAVLLGVKPSFFTDVVNPKVIAGDLTKAGPDTCAAQEAWADSLGLKVGDTVKFTGILGQVERKIHAIYNTTVVNASAICSGETAAELAPRVSKDASSVSLTVKKPAGATPEQADAAVAEVKQRLQNELKDLYIYRVMDREDTKEGIAQGVNTLLAVLYALLGLSIVIAILGIVNTLGMSVAERVREIAMIRAVGMQRGGIGVMIVIEAVIIALFGAIVGSVSGTAIAIAVQRYSASSGLQSLEIPYTQLLIFIGTAGVIGILAALIPAYTGSRRPILEGIASD